jgi:hypothetical protein
MIALAWPLAGLQHDDADSGAEAMHGWSVYGTKRAQPVAISGKRRNAKTAKASENPLPGVATCRDHKS